MARIISIHEYSLRSGVSGEDFEKAVETAVRRGLFRLPGLEAYHFLRGVKGHRKGEYAAVWIYRDREAWEELWGPPEHPVGKENYPEPWKIWEDEILAPLLDRDPDRIIYTS